MLLQLARWLRALGDLLDPPATEPDRVFWVDVPALPPSFFDALRQYEKGTN